MSDVQYLYVASQVSALASGVVLPRLVELRDRLLAMLRSSPVTTSMSPQLYLSTFQEQLGVDCTIIGVWRWPVSFCHYPLLPQNPWALVNVME
jgi:hypothetical protein